MCSVRDTQNVENGDKCTTDEMPKRRADCMPKELVRIEDALAQTKFGKFNYSLILISGIILYAALVETCGMTFVLPVSQCDMNYSTQEMGIITAVGFAGVIMSAHVWGFMADRNGRNRTMRPTFLISITCTILSTLTNNFWIFATLRFLTGFFISSSSTVYAYLGEFHGAERRSRAIIGAAFVFGICCITLPLSAYLIINQDLEFHVPLFDIEFKPWRLFLLSCSAPSVISFLALIILPESPKFELSQGRQEKAIEILEKINRWNNGGKSAKPLGIASLHEEKEDVENRLRQQEQKSGPFSWLTGIWRQTVHLFSGSYLRTTFLACAIQFGIFAVGNGVYMWFAEIMNRLGSNLDSFTSTRVHICDIIPNHVGLNETGAMEPVCIGKLELSTMQSSLLLECLYPLCYIVMGAMINYVGKLPILVTVLMGCGIAGFATLLTDIPLVAVILFILLLCSCLAATIVSAATVELYPTHLRAMAMCISLMMGRTGSVTGTNVVAYLIDDHCESIFLISGTTLIVCAVMCFFIPNIQGNDKKDETEPRVSVASRLG